jgi:hypothetical protein
MRAAAGPVRPVPARSTAARPINARSGTPEDLAPTELHVHPGVPHGFELFAPDADASRRATADRVRALRSF